MAIRYWWNHDGMAPEDSEDASGEDEYAYVTLTDYESLRAQLAAKDAEIARLRDIIRPGEAAAYEEGMAAALAAARRDALRAGADMAEVYLHTDPPECAQDELSKLARYSNSTVRRIAATLRARADQPEAAP